VDVLRSVQHVSTFVCFETSLRRWAVRVEALERESDEMGRDE